MPQELSSPVLDLPQRAFVSRQRISLRIPIPHPSRARFCCAADLCDWEVGARSYPDSEAVDFRAASELFAQIRPLRKQDLRTLRITTDHQGLQVPTVGGVLLFGKDRTTHFPDAWIQVGRFHGTDRRRILDSAELRSYPATAIEEAIAFVRRNTAREVVIEGARRADRWTYPLEAVREAVVNAVAHADYAQRGAPTRISIYDDRMEVESPGLLPFGLTVEEIKGGVSKLRNRVIGRVFHELGLIEQWGSGIQRMSAACERAGLPAPVLEEVATHFRVTLLSKRERPSQLDEVEELMLEALGEGRGLSTAEIAERISSRIHPARDRERMGTNGTSREHETPAQRGCQGHFRRWTHSG